MNKKDGYQAVTLVKATIEIQQALDGVGDPVQAFRVSLLSQLPRHERGFSPFQKDGGSLDSLVAEALATLLWVMADRVRGRRVREALAQSKGDLLAEVRNFLEEQKRIADKRKGNASTEGAG